MKREEIRISIPANSEYFSSIRLMTASISSKIGMDIEEIEDMRAVISEALNIVICGESININYTVEENSLQIKVSNDKEKIEYMCQENMKLSKQILEALTDKIEFKEDQILITKTKEV